jgi:hypothetical protein
MMWMEKMERVVVRGKVYQICNPANNNITSCIIFYQNICINKNDSGFFIIGCIMFWEKYIIMKFCFSTLFKNLEDLS